jgi:hypothetical protein
MPYTVATSFDRFIDNITLTGDHRAIANARKDRVASLLGNAFTILDSFATGSIPKLTALKGHADLDVIVVLHWAKHIKGKTPGEVLQDIRDALTEYCTNVRKNGQAVTLHYDSWPDVDIVPVSVTKNQDGSLSHYNVTDRNVGTWLASRPRQHSASIEQKASLCGPKFRPMVRMIKQWNREHDGLLASFHIEVMALSVFDSYIDDYPWAVFQYFDKAATLAASYLSYDGGFADDYLDTWPARHEVVKRLEAARNRARDAWHLTYNGGDQHKEAIEIWQKIFGNEFPSYG